MSKFKKGFIYARVSSEMQAEKGLSIPSQLELTREYAKQHDIEVAKEYVDEAESATTDQRPQFQEMIGECKKDDWDVDCIIVWKFSRFARDRFDSTVYKRLLGKKGIKVVSVSEPIVDGTPEGMVLEGVIEIFDDWYSRNLSREVLRGQKEAAKQGFHTGGQPPYGYQLKKIINNNTEKTVWEVNPSEAETVRKIFTLFSQGQGYGKIIHELENVNARPRKTEKWPKVSIHDILRRDCYTGKRVYNIKKTKDLGRRTLGKRFVKDQSEWIPISVPRIIDDATYQAVKERVDKKRQTRTKRQVVHLLTGLLKCGICESGYSYGAQGREGRYFYYRCTKKMNKGKAGCTNRNIKGELLDAAIIEKVSKTIFTEDNVKKFYSFVEKSKSGEKIDLEGRMEQNEKGLKEIEKKLNNYRKAIESGVDISLVVDPMNSLKDEKKKLEETNRELKARFENQPSAKAFKFSKKAYDNFMGMTKAFFERADTDNKRVFLQKFIQKIVVHPDKISIVYIPPILNSFRNSDLEDMFTIKMVPKRGLEPLRGNPH